MYLEQNELRATYPYDRARKSFAGMIADFPKRRN